MKKSLIALCLALSMVAFAPVCNAQMTKERREVNKELRKQLNEKASKDARKEEKRLAKEGWKAAPGALPMAKQLDRSYMMQYEMGEDGEPVYIMTESNSVGGNYDAAKMQAIELAKQNLAGLIQTELASMVKNDVANSQLSRDDAESLTKSISASQSVVQQSLGRILPIVEVYKEDKKTKKYHVLVKIAYNQSKAIEAAKQAVRKNLEEEGNALHEKLDQITNW